MINRHFTAYDGNGNVTGLADSTTGKWSARYEYGPFGEVIRMTGQSCRSNPFRFSTKYQDDETDLLYYGYRYYSASTGRWLSRDPIGERGGRNLYLFIGNSPLQNVDAVGLIRWGDDNWGCRVCHCKNVVLTYEPGGEFFQLGWYKAGSDFGGDIYKFGNKIHVRWIVTGDPSACSYYQDEGGTEITSQSLVPPSTHVDTKTGTDGHTVPQEYDDYLGALIPPGTRWNWTVKLKITFRCVSSKPFSDTVTQTLTKNIPSIIVDGDEIIPK